MDAILYSFFFYRVGVRLGEYNTDTDVDCVSNGPIGEECSDPPQNIPVEDRIAHENYDPQDQNQYNDIALLRLSRDAKFNGKIDENADLSFFI